MSFEMLSHLAGRRDRVGLFKLAKGGGRRRQGQQSNFIFENDKNIWGWQKHFKEIKHSKDGKTKKIPEPWNSEEIVKGLK